MASLLNELISRYIPALFDFTQSTLLCTGMSFYNEIMNKKISSIMKRHHPRSSSFRINPAGIGTVPNAGCRVSQGPVPPPLLIRKKLIFSYENMIT